MKIAICNIKGGSGKSTLAIHLATELHKTCPTLLIDTDPQRSISAFLSYREEKNLPFLFQESNAKELQNLLKDSKKKDTQHLIIDTSGRDSEEMRSAMVYSEICLIPTIPSGLDANVLCTMLSSLKEARSINHKIQGIVLIQRATPNPFLQKKIEEFKNFILSKQTKDFKLLKTILYEREAFRDSILKGQGITESQRKKDHKAKEEFLEFVQELQDTFKERE